MKIRILLLLLLSYSLNFSQTAPTIKVTDIYGNFHNSNDIIGQGKSIFIDFFTNSCSTCQVQAPVVDSTFKYFGCNCNDIFYFAMNTDEYSTDADVFYFSQTYGIDMTPISAEGNSANIADMLDVPWTPYYIMIDTNNQIVIDTFIFWHSAQELIDTLTNFGISQNFCAGTDILFLELISEKDTFPATIDNTTQEIYVAVNENTNLDSIRSFMISSANSKIFIDTTEIQQDSAIIDISDSTLTLKVVAEIDTIFKDWILKINLLPTQNHEQNDKFVIYPNPANNFIYLSDYQQITYYYIFNNSGKIISKVYPTQNEQNFSHLPAGIYFLSIKTKDGLTINQKIIKQ